MTKEELLNNLGINYPGRNVGDTYIVDIPDSNAYDKILAKMGRSNLLRENPDKSGFFENVMHSWYYFDDVDTAYDMELLADFNADTYNLYIMDVEIIYD